MGDKHQPTGLSATKFEIPNAPVKPASFDYKTGKLLRPGTNKPYDHEASNSSKRKKRGKKKTAKHKERSPEVQHANTPPMVSPSVSPALSPHVVSAIPANTQYGTPTAAVTNLQAHQLDRDAHEQHTNFDLDDEQAAEIGRAHV